MNSIINLNFAKIQLNQPTKKGFGQSGKISSSENGELRRQTAPSEANWHGAYRIEWKYKLGHAIKISSAQERCK